MKSTDFEMDSPHDSKDVQDLSKRLKDATFKLQRVKSEREEVNMEVHQRREEMDRRTLLLLHVDNRVCDTLMELEAAKQKKQTLVQLIESLSTHTWETKLSSVSVGVMQKKVEVLEEEANKLKLQCEKVKKALDDVQESKYHWRKVKLKKLQLLSNQSEKEEL